MLAEIRAQIAQPDFARTTLFVFPPRRMRGINMVRKTARAVPECGRRAGYGQEIKRLHHPRARKHGRFNGGHLAFTTLPIRRLHLQMQQIAAQIGMARLGLEGAFQIADKGAPLRCSAEFTPR